MKWCICHCMRSVRIRSFSGPYFAAFGLNTESISPYSVGMRENADQKNPEYGYFSRSVFHDCSKGTGTGHFYCAKSVQIRSFSGPQFPIFGLNTEIYIQSKYGKIQIRKIPCLETFCAVFNVYAPTIPKFPNYFLLQINHMPAGWSSIMTIYQKYQKRTQNFMKSWKKESLASRKRLSLFLEFQKIKYLSRQ